MSEFLHNLSTAAVMNQGKHTIMNLGKHTIMNQGKHTTMNQGKHTLDLIFLVHTMNYLKYSEYIRYECGYFHKVQYECIISMASLCYTFSYYFVFF